MANAADQARMKVIVGMAVSFSGMLRVFAPGQVRLIEGMILKLLLELSSVHNQLQFDALHNRFCSKFMTGICCSSRYSGNSSPSYGQAAKLLDVTLKACVDFCHLPDEDTAARIRPFLHCGIDTAMMNDLCRCKKEHITVRPASLAQVDAACYRLLQAAVQNRIKHYSESISPVDYDNIMFLN